MKMVDFLCCISICCSSSPDPCFRVKQRPRSF